MQWCIFTSGHGLQTPRIVGLVRSSLSTQTLQKDEAPVTEYIFTITDNHELKMVNAEIATVKARLNRAYEQAQDVGSLDQQLGALYQVLLRM